MTNVIKQRQLKDKIDYGVEVSTGSLSTDIGSIYAATTLQDGNVFIPSQYGTKFMIVAPDGTEVSTGSLSTDIGSIYAATTLQDGNVFMVSDDGTKFMVVTPDGTEISTGSLSTDIGSIYAATTLQDGNVFIPSQDGTKFMIVTPDGTEISTGSFATDIGIIRAATTLQDGNIFMPSNEVPRFLVVKPDGTEISTGTLPTDIGYIRGAVTLQKGNVFMVSTDGTKFMIVAPDGTEVSTGSLSTDIGSIYAATTLQDGNVFMPDYDSTVFLIINPELHTPMKLTPKTDFVYHSISTNEVKIYDRTANVKGSYRTSLGKPLRVGKGQIIDFQGWVPSWSICLVDGNGTQLNALTIETNYDGEYLKTKNIITFLGKPFTAEGDNDRYCLVNYFDNEKYGLILLNIDTWTFQVRNLNTSYPMYDLHFDGVDTCYFIRSDDLHKITIRKDNFSSTPNSPLYLNNDGTTRITAQRIYGVFDNYLIFEGTSQYQYCNLTTGEIINGYGGNHPANNIIPTNSSYHLVSLKDDARIALVKDTGFPFWALTQAMVDNAMIGDGEINVSPQLITNFEETDTTIIFTMVYVRSAGGTIGYGTFNIDKASGTITIPNKLWKDGVVSGIAQDVLNNSFQNSCNSYDIGKFYDYGLQKQFNKLP